MVPSSGEVGQFAGVEYVECTLPKKRLQHQLMPLGFDDPVGFGA